MHKLAFKAAEASQCAREQGKFWEMHQSLMADQDTLDALNTHAESIQIDVARFETCLNTDQYADSVRQDIALAEKLGVNSTPSFLIALASPEDPLKVKGLHVLKGAAPFTAFKQVLDQILGQLPEKSGE